jgi:hypothetical protein
LCLHKITIHQQCLGITYAAQYSLQLFSCYTASVNCFQKGNGLKISKSSQFWHVPCSECFSFSTLNPRWETLHSPVIWWQLTLMTVIWILLKVQHFHSYLLLLAPAASVGPLFGLLVSAVSVREK